MAAYLQGTMPWYIEWPNVDGSFMTVYNTLPGYALDNSSADEDDEAE